VSEHNDEIDEPSSVSAHGVAFGRYQLLRKIATGGMAQLYLAHIKGEADFTKLCVVKKILPHLGEQKRFVEMFLDEARIAATLNHPNIVQIYDLGKVKSAYFIAMEYIQGEDLSHLAKRAVTQNRSLPVELCCRIIADLCAGLHYAHESRDQDNKPLNLVHRDVSPQNVLVTYDGQIKIVDFGIAKAANKVSHTRTGTVMGKAAYMSPEQCLGKELDRRSDVFSVGILLHELLVLKRLFKRENELLTMRAITEEDAAAPSQIRLNLSPKLDAIVAKALHRDREQRYASCQQLRAALEQFIVESAQPATSMELSGLLQSLFPDHVERRTRAHESGSLSEVIRALPSTGVRDLGTPSALLSSTMTETESRLLKKAPASRRRLLWAFLAVFVLSLGAVVGFAYKMLQPSFGHAVITSTPAGARIVLDQREYGVTPLAIDDLMLEHAYQLELSASGFIPHHENLYLSADLPSREVSIVMQARPQAAFGTIVVETRPPGAKVFLDGKDSHQVTPARLPDLAADLEYEVRMVLDGYHEAKRRVLLRSGAEQQVTLTLDKQVDRTKPRNPRGNKSSEKDNDPVDVDVKPQPIGSGFLTLRTTPWTRVSFGQLDLGETPLFKVELPAGTVKLRLVNKAKQIDRVISVEIEADKVVNVDRKLE
jgi:serine/threonine-protein kinase